MTEHETPIPSMRLRTAALAAALVVLLELVVSGWGWTVVPDGALVPVHWGIDGRPNGFAPKDQGLLLLPAVTAGMALLLAILPRFEPRRTNLARSAGAYRLVVVGIVVLLGALHVVAVLAAAGVPVDIGRAVTFGLGLLFALIGNVLGKVRSNYLFGIRTPWTLASDLSWNRTHRLTGRLWVTGGLGLTALAIVGAPPEVLATWIAIAIGGSTIGGIAYSYRVWKDDPNHQQLGR